jgi:hypothetical protein
MNKASALEYLLQFLEKNPNLKPTNGCMLSEPYEQSINNEKIFYVCWTESDGRNARGGHQYYILPDGAILMPFGGTGHPETLEDIYSRWQSQK